MLVPPATLTPTAYSPQHSKCIFFCCRACVSRGIDHGRAVSGHKAEANNEKKKYGYLRRLCTLVWRLSSSERAKRRVQPGWVQAYGFSPVWVRM